jgi:hypothetical protein
LFLGEENIQAMMSQQGEVGEVKSQLHCPPSLLSLANISHRLHSTKNWRSRDAVNAVLMGQLPRMQDEDDQRLCTKEK